MRKRDIPSLVCFSLLAFTFVRLSAQQQLSQPPRVVQVDGDVEFTHDPSIAKDGDTWYLFSTNNGPDRSGDP